MKKFFKFASYTLLYVIITFASAFGVVLISSNSSSDDDDFFDEPAQEIAIPSQLTQMLSQITSANGLDVYLKADIESGKDNYSIAIDALVDLENGFEDISVDGNVTVMVNDDMFAVDIKYNQGVLFFELFNGKFKIETDNIMDSVTELLDIMNIEFPSLGVDLSKIDINAVLSLLSDLTETKGDNSIVIKLNIPVLGEIQLVCDINYSISHVIIPKTSISDTVISLTSNFDYPDEVVIDTPEEDEYTNISDLFLIAESVLGLLDQENLGLDMSLGYNDLTLNASLSADLKEFNSKLTLKNILGYDANLIAVDDVIYLEFGNINLCYDLKKSCLITNLLERQFGISIPLDQITKILVSINDGTLMQQIGSLFPENNGGVDLASIDLSIIESLNRVENKYTFSVSGIGEISCVIEERKLKSISFNGFGFDVSASVVEPKEIGLTYDKANYINLEDIIPALDALFSSIKYPTFTGGLSIDINGQNYYADYTLSINGEERIVKLTANLYGQKLEIIATNEDVFLQISEFKIKAKYSNINDIVKFIQYNFKMENSEETVKVLLNQVKVFLDPELYPALITQIRDENNNLIISTRSGNVVTIGYDKTIDRVSYTDGDIDVNLTINVSEDVIEDLGIDEGDYTTIENILSILQNTIDYVKSGKFYLDLQAEYDNIKVAGAVNFDLANKSLEFTFGIIYDELNAIVTFLDNKIYVEVGKNYFMFDTNDINLVLSFISENLGINVAEKLQGIIGIMPLDNLDEIDSKMHVSTLDIEGIIKSIVLANNNGNLSLEVMGGKIELNFKDFALSNITANYKNLSANVNILDKATEFNLDKNYTDISKLIGFVDILKNYVTSERYYVSANADVFENDELIYATDDARIEVDMTGEKLALYSAVKVTGRDNHSMEVYYHDDFLYANYNELLIKIKSADLGEIVVLLMEMVGIDPSILPFLQDIAGNMDEFSLGAIELPSMSMTQVLSILNMFEGITIDNNTLSIKLNLFGEVGTISIETDRNELKAITLENIAVSNEQKFNLDINCIDFAEIGSVHTPDESKNWYDISGSNELIKAILNMSDMRDFEISGTFDLDAKVIGISINKKIPFNAKIKIVDGKLEMMAQVGTIPVITAVNKDAPSGLTYDYNGDNRMAYIYLKDEYVYIHRTESTSKHGAYEKKTKIHYTEFLSDPMYYLQYIVGLSDTIMKEIDKAMELSRNREKPIDVSNIFVNDEEGIAKGDNTYQFTLNLAEISNNPQLKDLGFGLKVVENKDTGKNVIGGMTFHMYAPIASVFTVTLDSNDIQINAERKIDEEGNETTVYVNKDLDLSEMYEYVNSYTYAENEQWETKDGNENRAGARTYTITFVENGGYDVNDITAEVGAEINIPTYSDRYVDDLENRTRTTYQFIGWFEDEAMTTPFNKTTMPRFGATLHAKWEVIKIENIFVLTFETNGGYAIDSVNIVEGQSFDLGSLNPTRYRDATKGKYNAFGEHAFKVTWSVTRYTFAGWYYDSELTNVVSGEIILNKDTTLYAKWDSQTGDEYYLDWESPN